jgi:hypothetical protein
MRYQAAAAASRGGRSAFVHLNVIRQQSDMNLAHVTHGLMN